MKVLLALSRVIDGAARWLGQWVAWLVIAAALSAGNAVIRKLFDVSSVAVQRGVPVGRAVDAWAQ